MESPHPDERPSKKRRFFTEDSSPACVRTKPPDSPPHSPPPQSVQPTGTPDETNGDHQPDEADGFDFGMLQAVVGELPETTMQKLKDVSGSDVQRGGQDEADNGHAIDFKQQ